MSRLIPLLCLWIATATHGGVVDVEFNEVWSYSGPPNGGEPLPPEKWHEKFHHCGGGSQSPIDLRLGDTVVPERGDSEYLEPISLAGYVPGDALVRNKGPYVDLRIDSPKKYPLVDGRGTRYLLSGVHFHWSQDTLEGSEHAMQGRRWASEAHLVHFNAKFTCLAEAVASGEHGAVTVVGVLLDAKAGDEHANPELERILRFAGDLKYPSEREALMSQFDPRLLITGTDVNSSSPAFLFYNGSLTTPGCDPVVHWYVVQEPSSMSMAQLSQMRRFTHVAKNVTLPFRVMTNARPVQPVNGRKLVAHPKLPPVFMRVWVLTLVLEFVGGVSIIAVVSTVALVLVCWRQRKERLYTRIN